jgi:hypothetical protein
MKSQTRFSTIRGLLPRAHIEGRRGSQEQAIAYCKKDGKYQEYGTPKTQGYRSDLDNIRVMASTEGLRAVTAVGNYQQIQIASRYLTYNEEPRNWVPNVIWLYGISGCGKSRRGRELCGEDLFVKNDDTKWWDGYDGHEYVILDDFRESWMSMSNLLGLLDRYEYRVETKGGWRQFKPTTIIITTIKAPELHYSGSLEPITQLLRRVSEVSEVGGNTSSPPLSTFTKDTDDILRFLEEIGSA